MQNALPKFAKLHRFPKPNKLFIIPHVLLFSFQFAPSGNRLGAGRLLHEAVRVPVQDDGLADELAELQARVRALVERFDIESFPDFSAK